MTTDNHMPLADALEMLTERDRQLEQATKVMHAEVCCPCDPQGCDWTHTREARYAHALADAGLLARPLPTREEIAMAIAARHWDRDSGDVEVWHDLTLGEREAVAENYLTWDSAYAVIALLKGQEA